MTADMTAWIVDANNVVGSRPDGWWHDRAAALERLVDEVTRWHKVAGDPVVVVADGYPTTMLPAFDTGAFRLVYAQSNAPNAADDEIIRIVEDAPDPTDLRVVTSDRRLRERVTAAGAGVEGARRFLDVVADIEPRRSDRAVLAHYGVDERALLGHGGEARVFALDEERVLRLPHFGRRPTAVLGRERLLAAIGTSDVITIPEVVAVEEVAGRTVLIERRLPGTNAMRVLASSTGVRRAALIRNYLDAARQVAELHCPTSTFGEVGGRHAIKASSFSEWSVVRLRSMLQAAGPDFSEVDAAAISDALVSVLPDPTPDAPVLVHLDVWLGNLLAEEDRITALLDFSPLTIGGVRDLDPLIAIAYLAPEITPPATDVDRAVAREWAADTGLGAAVDAAERWAAAYWAAESDHQLRRWCRRMLLGT